MNTDLTKDQKIAKQESDLRTLQERQQAEAAGHEQADTVPGNRNPSFKIRKIEADGYVHVFTRVKHFNDTTKTINNEDRVVKIHNRDFDTRVKQGAFATYDEVDVVHDGRKNGPKTYELKPSQVDPEGNVQDMLNKQSGASKKEIEAQKAHLQKKSDELDSKMATIDAKIAELKSLESKKQPVAEDSGETKKK